MNGHHNSSRDFRYSTDHDGDGGERNHIRARGNGGLPGAVCVAGAQAGVAAGGHAVTGGGPGALRDQRWPPNIC